MATIKIKQIKSKIGAPVDQKRTLACLGLHKISPVSYTHLTLPTIEP